MHTTITTEFGIHQQSLQIITIAKRGDNKRFRARIKRNAYDHQSEAVTEVWTANGWAEVTRVLDITTLGIADFSYTTEDAAWQKVALKDADRLLGIAMDVVP